MKYSFITQKKKTYDHQYGHGFEIRDPSEFGDWGPDRGVEGNIDHRPEACYLPLSPPSSLLPFLLSHAIYNMTTWRPPAKDEDGE